MSTTINLEADDRASWTGKDLSRRPARAGARGTGDRRVDRARRDRRAAGPQRSGQVNHDRHDARARRAGWRRGARVRRSPREAVDAGTVGAMLQTGELIRDLSVRELIALVASLYPDALDASTSAGAGRLGDVADQRTQKLSGGQTQRIRFAVALVSRSRTAGARRADRRAWTCRGGGTSGRRCATTRRAAGRCCSPPTTSRRPTPTPTGPC